MEGDEESSSFEFTLPDGDAYRPEGMPILFRNEINGDEEEFKFFQDLAYEGAPDEVIRNFKDKGNEFMRKYPTIPKDNSKLQKKCLEDAIQYYSQALTVEDAPVDERANCLSNRAYALMLYGTPTSLNSAKMDAFECVKICPSHTRGILRCLAISVETEDPRGVYASLRMIAKNEKDKKIIIPPDLQKTSTQCIKNFVKDFPVSINMALLRANVRVAKAPVPLNPMAKKLRWEVSRPESTDIMDAFHSKRNRVENLLFSVQVIRVDTGMIDLLNDIKATTPVGNILITVLSDKWKPVFLPDWRCKCRKPAMQCTCWKAIKPNIPLSELVKLNGFSIEPEKGLIMIYALRP